MPDRKTILIVEDEAIIRMNETVLKYMKKPGIFICSGIIEERLDDVLSSLNQHGLRAVKVVKMGEWRAVACMNKG